MLTELADNSLHFRMIAVFLSVLTLVNILGRFAERLGLIDVPDSRKLHGENVPVIGGLAIFLTTTIALILMPPPAYISWFLGASFIVVAIGALDDAYSSGITIRLSTQSLATIVLIVGAGVWVETLGDSTLQDYQLNIWIGVPLTVIAVVGLTNSTNMIDGIDGLAASQGLVSLGFILLLVCLKNPNPQIVEWILVLAAAISAFLVVNLGLTPCKKVFLGDAGSLYVGFSVSWILIFISQNPIGSVPPLVVVWIVTLPVFDFISVVLTRLLYKRSPFAPDRIHLHHLLLDIGYSAEKTLWLMIVFSIIANAIGLFIFYLVSPITSITIYVILFLLFFYISKPYRAASLETTVSKDTDLSP